VVDQAGFRTLCFDDATESQISIQSPLKGHFEYTEYFHMGWLWNARLTNVLMVGLGGRHDAAGVRALLSQGHHPERGD